MSQALVFEVEDRHQKVEVVVLGDLEDISANQLLHEVFSELRSDLKSIDPQ